MNLIGYLSLGYPTIKDTFDVADIYVGNGVDVLEIDFPAADPFMDSELIQNRMKAALKACSNYDEYMKAIVKIQKLHPKTQIYILAYEETIKTIGVDKFTKFMNDQKLTELIYVSGDNKKIKKHLEDNNIRLAQYVRLHLPEEDLVQARGTKGFIYLQAKSDKAHPQYKTIKEVIAYLRQNEAKNKLINCGVGVSTTEDLKRVKDAGADGAFIGSTFLKLHGDVPALKAKIQEFKAVIK